MNKYNSPKSAGYLYGKNLCRTYKKKIIRNKDKKLYDNIMVVEEAALVDGTLLSEVIIPMMNIPRLCLSGGTNPTEPHSQQTYINLCHYMETYNRKPPELLENLFKNRQSAAKSK